MAKKVIKYAATDGTEFATEMECCQYEAGQSGRAHLCPQCKGKQHITGKPIMKSVEDKKATDWSGQFGQPQYHDVIVGHEEQSCPTCDGWGFTAEEMKPIKEVKVVGWKA